MHYQKIVELINESESTAIVHANSGGGHPDDIPLKKDDYLNAYGELLAAVLDLCKRKEVDVDYYVNKLDRIEAIIQEEG